MPVSKWEQFRIMKGNKILSVQVPETQILTEKTFLKAFDKYTQFIVKPDFGRFGNNIIQVSKVGENLFEIHNECDKLTIEGREETFQYIKEKFLSKRYLLQQKIKLASIDDCIFDLRVMVQRRKGSSKWKVTGKLAKVAKKGYIITNEIKEILIVEEAIQNSSLKESPLLGLIAEIDRVALLAAIRFGNIFTRSRRIGFDIGVDEKGKIWVIEANFLPIISFFEFLEDKSIYQEIIKFL